MMIYKGYECCKNSLTGRFYALLIGDEFTFNKVVADSAAELKAAIDLVAVEPRLDPWELSYARVQGPKQSVRLAV
jgi:hypothetical protein